MAHEHHSHLHLTNPHLTHCQSLLLKPQHTHLHTLLFTHRPGVAQGLSSADLLYEVQQPLAAAGQNFALTVTRKATGQPVFNTQGHRWGGCGSTVCSCVQTSAGGGGSYELIGSRDQGQQQGGGNAFERQRSSGQK